MAPDILLQLKAVSKFFPGGIVGLDAIELDVRQGEFVSLLGPSGCGKTTTLRVIAGFEQPTSGQVVLGGQDITHLRPYDRPVNTVFQDYALFPHMSVAENVGFGLALRKFSAAEIRGKVRRALDLVGLPDKMEARVSALSGGQRQRIALARAIVCEPRVLLLDEPLSALDAHLREHMQIELKNLQQRLGTTFIMVTHDQTEALAISDKIVVMNRGRIEQIASPPALYDAPATRFVAGFIGTMNVLECQLIDRRADHALIGTGPLTFEVPMEGSGRPGDPIAIGLRPEDILIEADDAPDTTAAHLVGSVFHGRTIRLHIQLSDGTALTVDAPRQSAPMSFSPGDALHLRVRPNAARVLQAS